MIATWPTTRDGKYLVLHGALPLRRQRPSGACVVTALASLSDVAIVAVSGVGLTAWVVWWVRGEDGRSVGDCLGWMDDEGNE